MATSTQAPSDAKPIPTDYRAITPWIISRDSDALIAYIVKAFDGVELARLVNEAGRIVHAEVKIGDSIVMLFDSGENWPETPAFLRLYVPDADQTVKKAVEAGGKLVTKVTHLAFGDRVGRIQDPQGNVWWVHAHIEYVDPKEMERRMSDPAFTEAMKYVESSLSEFMAKGRSQV